MADPSVTGSLQKLEEQHGALLLMLALLRRYWPRVIALICAVFVCGKFFNQFEQLQAGQEALTKEIAQQNDHIERQEGHMEAIDANILSIKEGQSKADARWEAIHAAADIVVQPHRHK